MVFRFVEQERATFPVITMCRVLWNESSVYHHQLVALELYRGKYAAA